MAFYTLDDGSLAFWPDGQTPPWQSRIKSTAQDPNAPETTASWLKQMGGGFDGFSSPTGNYTGARTGQALDRASFGQGPEFYSNLQDWRNQNSGAGWGAGSLWNAMRQENPDAFDQQYGDASQYQWQNGVPYRYNPSSGRYDAVNIGGPSGKAPDWFSNAAAYDPSKGNEYNGPNNQAAIDARQKQLLDAANQRLNGGVTGGSNGSTTMGPTNTSNWWKSRGLNSGANWGNLNFGNGGGGTGGWQPDGTFNPAGGASIYQGFNGQAGNGGAWQNSPIDFVAANQSYQMARKQGLTSPYYGASGWQGNNNNYSGSNYGTSPFATMQNNQKNNSWFQGLNTTQQIEAMKRANALKAQDVYAGKGLQGGYFKQVQDTWGS